MLNNIVALLGNGSGGGGSSYESIATATGDGSSSSITFSSIPSTYKHLQLRILARSVSAGTSSVLYIRPNNDTSSTVYTYHHLRGDGTNVSAYGYGTSNGATEMITTAMVANAGQTAGIFGATIVDFADYASTSKYKTMRALCGLDDNGAGGGQVSLVSNLWLSTSSISSLVITRASGAFATGTSIALYGIKG